MLEPKKTLVGLAGQKARHIWAGDGLPRSSGKYRPSQLRTQKAGPELATAGRHGGPGCGVVPERSKKFACGAAWWSCGFCGPPYRKSQKASAGTGPPLSTTRVSDPAA